MNSAMAIGLRPSGCRPWRNFRASGGHAAAVGAHRRPSCQRLGRRGASCLKHFRIKDDQCSAFRRNLSARVGATEEGKGPPPPPPPPDSSSSGWKQRYHPSEEIDETLPLENGEEARLTDAEIARTVVEVHNTAALMFVGFIGDEIHENIIWPQMSYLTDEHGDVYFELNSEEVLQSLIADDRLMQVIIGLDNVDILSEVEILVPDLDYGEEDISSDESDTEDDYDEDDVSIEEDEMDEILSSENLDDWTNLETMQSCHPMYFAKRIVEAISNTSLDCLDQPPASVVIQGHLRPASVEESKKDKKLSSGKLDADQDLPSGVAFYKLEIVNIQLVSAYGNQSAVKVEDFRKVRPDVIAHSAANIISRLKAGGENIFQALKSLCWRKKSMNVEEAIVVGVDSLGFDLRVCSGTQVQTLRFSFKKRATSEFHAETQLYDLLFPRLQQTGETSRNPSLEEC